MAELVVTQDELALRRRARRRLVGAVAIALTSIVALPMLFDSEPKPLGPEVDIRIPAQNTPFETAPSVTQPVTQPVQPAPEPKPAEPTQSSAPATAPAKAATTPASETTKPVAGAARSEASSAAANDKAKIDKKPPATPAAEKPKPKPEQKPELKPPLKPDLPFAAQGYFLQLGAFGSESNARQLQEKASAAGFKAVMNGANGQFRVRVGPIPQHEKALEIQARLKARGFSPVLLGP